MNSFLDKIPGQLRLKNTLNNFLLSKQIPHAILFTGMEGIGKDNAAIQFAKSVVFEKNKIGESEKNIRGIEKLQAPYLKLIFPLPRGKNEDDSSSPTEKLTPDDLDLIIEQIEIKSKNLFHKISIPKANSIKINSIRDIKKFISLNYDEATYRVILITDAHLMNDAAQNALLKNLEEPPQNVIFILTTSIISKLRPTIISRCWKINFDPLSDKEIVVILRDKFSIKKELAEEVAPFSMGSVQTALKLIEFDFKSLKEKTISILRYSFGRKFDSAFNELNSVLTKDKSSGFKILISMMLVWLNDVQKYKLNIDNLLYKDQIETVVKFNSKFPNIDINFATSRLERLSNLTQNNINPSVLSANLIFELSSVILETR
jgi:DNA polymerase-3 subunit delta'